MLLLTALGLVDVGDGDGELCGVLGSDQSQRRERDEGSDRVHLDGFGRYGSMYYCEEDVVVANR